MTGRTERLPRCGVLMTNAQEPCARAAGHKPGRWGGHATRYALDNMYRAKMGRDPDPYCFRGGQWVAR